MSTTERGEPVAPASLARIAGVCYLAVIAGGVFAALTAVTRTESVELVRSIGADEVIDYRSEDFTRRGERYDVFFDIGGNRTLGECRRVPLAEAAEAIRYVGEGHARGKVVVEIA